MTRRRHTRGSNLGAWFFALLLLAFVVSRWSIIGPRLFGGSGSTATETQGSDRGEAGPERDAESEAATPSSDANSSGAPTRASDAALGEPGLGAALAGQPVRDELRGNSNPETELMGIAGDRANAASDGIPGALSALEGGLSSLPPLPARLPSGPPAALMDRLLGEDRELLLGTHRALNEEDAFLTSVEALQLAGLGELELRHLLRREDPLRPARAELFTLLAEQALDDLEDALRYERALLAALCHEEAVALAENARAEGAALETFDARLVDIQAELFSDLKLLQRLRRAGVPLPESARRASGATERRWESRDREHDERAELPSWRDGRLELEGELSSAEASELLDACRAAMAHTEKRWSLVGTRSLRISVQPTLRAFRARLALAGVPRDTQANDDEAFTESWPQSSRAALDTAVDEIVLLDPRVEGASLARVHGLAAREIARWSLRRAFEQDDGAGLPTWLEEGLARTYAGWRRRTLDGEWYPARPQHLLDAVRFDMRGHGVGRATLEDLYALEATGEEAGAAAWNFVRYLQQARDASGELLFAAGLDDLLTLRAGGASFPARDEILRHFTSKPVQRAAGVASLIDLKKHWWGTTLDAALDDNLKRELARVDAALVPGTREEARDAAADTLHDLARRFPFEPSVQARQLELAATRTARDEMFLFASLLARSATSAEPRDKAWDRAASLSRQLAEQLREHDAAARAAVDELLVRYAAAERPHGARLLLNRLQAAQPTHAAWPQRLERETFAGPALSLELHPLAHREAPETSSKGWLWEQRAGILKVNAADTVTMTSLRSLWALEPPYTLRVTLELENLIGNGGLQRIGLSFGARDELDDGDWALFLEPSGRVSLASRGGLEWPARRLVRAGRPRDASFTLRVEEHGFELDVGELQLPWHDAGVRRLGGGLGVLAQRVQAHVRGLRVDLRPYRSARGHWALVLRP